MPDGSLNPFSGSFVVGMPPMLPKMTGCCCVSESRKKPTTCEPGTKPVGVVPTPLTAALVIGCIGCDQGS